MTSLILHALSTDGTISQGRKCDDNQLSMPAIALKIPKPILGSLSDAADARDAGL